MTIEPANPIQPEVIEPAEVESLIKEPTKIIRIASMTKAMLDEARLAPVDPAGRRRLLDIHERSLSELGEVLSDDVRAEFREIFQPLSSETPSESELRIAQAQLVGWLEGLFHGIQASLMSQQIAAQSQLAEMHTQALEAGKKPTPPNGDFPGVYL